MSELAGEFQPLRTRVRQYYRTPLGAAKPHKGGWWLKTLSVLDGLYVHYATTPDFKDAEEEMMRVFSGNLSASSLASWPDDDPVMPFANLRDGDWRRRGHGIRGATASSIPAVPGPGRKVRATRKSDRSRKSASSFASREVTRGAVTPHLRTQNITTNDIKVGQVRVPGPAKTVLPRERCDLHVRLRGCDLNCRWDPRYGPPERSGVIRVGKAVAGELISAGEVLRLTVVDDQVIELT